VSFYFQNNQISEESRIDKPDSSSSVITQTLCNLVNAEAEKKVSICHNDVLTHRSSYETQKSALFVIIHFFRFDELQNEKVIALILNKISVRIASTNMSIFEDDCAVTVKNVLYFFVLHVIYICKDEKTKDISSEDICERTFLTVFAQ
jgi:hypothetical protein